MNEITLRWWHYLLPPAILSFFTSLIYYPSLKYQFAFDDLPTIANNYEIRCSSPLGLFFGSPRWISKLLNQFTVRHWNLDPFAYRIIDLGIHLFAGLLVFTLILILSMKATKRPFFQKHALLLASITSGLFLLHPAQTQTATYITQIRLEGLVTIFTLFTLIAFACACYAQTTWAKILLFSLCGLFMIFAVGTKEIIVILPILLLLIDWFFLAEGETGTFLKRLPIHAILAGIFYYCYFKIGIPVKPTDILSLKMELPNNRGNLLTPTATELITPAWFMFAQFKVMLHYISIFFWPFGLSFDYGWKIPSTIWPCILPFLLLIGIIGYGIKQFLKNNISIITFCIAWFFIIMLPRTTIIPSTEFVCDYKTYLASLAPLLLLGIAFAYLATKINLPNLHPQLAQFVLPVILCTALGFGSMSRNKIWFSLETLWEDVVTKTYPHVPARAYNNYAAGLVEAGKEDKAIEFYLKAIETDRTYAEPVVNLALHYQMKNDISTALRYYQHAMMLKEAHPEMYNNLGLLHLGRKNYDQAIQAFETSLKLKPYYSKALFNLGRVYYEQNKLDQALVYYEKAMNGDQQTINYCYTHGMVSYMAQHYDKAIKSLEKVETAQPNLNNTRFLLASCYYNTGQPQKALPYFEFIYMQNPTNPLCCYNYAQSLLQTGQFAKALPLFMQCKNVPQLPHAPLHFIKCLHKVGEIDHAKKEVASFIKQATNKTLKQMGLQLKKEIFQA